MHPTDYRPRLDKAFFKEVTVEQKLKGNVGKRSGSKFKPEKSSKCKCSKFTLNLDYSRNRNMVDLD